METWKIGIEKEEGKIKTESIWFGAVVE